MFYTAWIKIIKDTYSNKTGFSIKANINAETGKVKLELPDYTRNGRNERHITIPEKNILELAELIKAKNRRKKEQLEKTSC